jgi:uncharacterized protein YgiB involved in biofilm formation
VRVQMHHACVAELLQPLYSCAADCASRLTRMWYCSLAVKRTDSEMLFGIPSYALQHACVLRFGCLKHVQSHPSPTVNACATSAEPQASPSNRSAPWLLQAHRT